jgi:rhodanese-related sulfurtransferase
MTPKRLYALYQQSPQSFICIDIRTADEAKESIPFSVHMDMSHFVDAETLRHYYPYKNGPIIRKKPLNFHKKLYPHRHKAIVIYCRSGKRADCVIQEIQKKYHDSFDVHMLYGGFKAWKGLGYPTCLKKV